MFYLVVKQLCGEILNAGISWGITRRGGPGCTVHAYCHWTELDPRADATTGLGQAAVCGRADLPPGPAECHAINS